MNNIKQILNDLITILQSTGESNWKNVLNNFYNDLTHVESDSDARRFANELMQIYGGMGSFSDLVLYQNNQPCITENNTLDDARKKLYKELEAILEK